MIIFNGQQFAQQKEEILRQRVAELKSRGKELKIAVIFFQEDPASVLYTNLKKEAANRVGIAYEGFPFSIFDDALKVIAHLHGLSADASVTGIMIQKPSRSRWIEVFSKANQEKNKAEYEIWWKMLVDNINEGKDVDGLHPNTLDEISRGIWIEDGKVLPATVRAVLSILDASGALQSLVFPHPKIIILGKSNILGQPLFYELKNKGHNVEMLASRELEVRLQTGQKLTDADIIVSATGRPGLITGELIKPGVILIDVGEPKADVDVLSVADKAQFLTPVPGGVGPVTVMSLLENVVELAE